MSTDDVLRNAFTAGVDVIRDSELEPALETSSSQKIVEEVWPVLEGLKDQPEFHRFAEQFRERFGRELMPFGGSIFDYVAGNVRIAVLHEAIDRLNSDLQSLESSRANVAFKDVPKRDWAVAISRIKDDISILRTMID